ncbi:hydroxyisourate hydrolase [Paenibacillus sp. N3.4]|uniref:hydroxyisourate hydrolase n=1 Tax=Paenibacillus sp. N3.4 TaxID=2603222 RepID=UPI0028FCF8C2|nr:hydroxyisourate hydrolase [Paenibacillus sp. N3.4]
MRIDLFRLDNGGSQLLHSAVTNGDGRVQGELLSGKDFTPGMYELVFHVGPYFRSRGTDLAEPAFLEEVPVRFGVSGSQAHYHVPLLIAPWGYNTYRGS